MTDWSSDTGRKELAEFSGKHTGMVTSLGRFCHSNLFSIHDRHHGKAYRTTLNVTLFFF